MTTGEEIVQESIRQARQVARGETPTMTLPDRRTTGGDIVRESLRLADDVRKGRKVSYINRDRKKSETFKEDDKLTGEEIVKESEKLAREEISGKGKKKQETTGTVEDEKIKSGVSPKDLPFCPTCNDLDYTGKQPRGKPSQIKRERVPKGMAMITTQRQPDKPRVMQKRPNPLAGTVSYELMKRVDRKIKQLESSDLPVSDIAAGGLKAYGRPAAAATSAVGGIAEAGADVYSWLTGKAVDYPSPDIGEVAVKEALGKKPTTREEEAVIRFYQKHPGALWGAVLGEAGLIERGAKYLGKGFQKAGAKFSSDVAEGLVKAGKVDQPVTEVRKGAKTVKQFEDVKIDLPPVARKFAEKLFPKIRTGEDFASKKVIDVGGDVTKFGKQALKRPTGEGVRVSPDVAKRVKQAQKGFDEVPFTFTDEGVEITGKSGKSKVGIKAEPGKLFGGKTTEGEDLLGRYKTFEGYGAAKTPEGVETTAKYVEETKPGVGRVKSLRKLFSEEAGKFLPPQVEEVGKTIDESVPARFVDESKFFKDVGEASSLAFAGFKAGSGLKAEPEIKQEVKEKQAVSPLTKTREKFIQREKPKKGPIVKMFPDMFAGVKTGRREIAAEVPSVGVKTMQETETVTDVKPETVPEPFTPIPTPSVPTPTPRKKKKKREKKKRKFEEYWFKTVGRERHRDIKSIVAGLDADFDKLDKGLGDFDKKVNKRSSMKGFDTMVKSLDTYGKGI